MNEILKEFVLESVWIPIVKDLNEPSEFFPDGPGRSVTIATGEESPTHETLHRVRIRALECFKLWMPKVRQSDADAAHWSGRPQVRHEALPGLFPACDRDCFFSGQITHQSEVSDTILNRDLLASECSEERCVRPGFCRLFVLKDLFEGFETERFIPELIFQPSLLTLGRHFPSKNEPNENLASLMLTIAVDPKHVLRERLE
ncbi:MAG: hypothetical protein ABIT01_05330, partial [Thermoanaerobaculia bacterium]